MATRKYMVIDSSDKFVRVVEVTTQTDSLKDYELPTYADFLEKPAEEVKEEIGYSLYRHFTTNVTSREIFSSSPREALVSCLSRMDVADYVTDVMFQVVTEEDFDEFTHKLFLDSGHYEQWQEYKKEHEEELETAEKVYELNKAAEKAEKEAAKQEAAK